MSLEALSSRELLLYVRALPDTHPVARVRNRLAEDARQHREERETRPRPAAPATASEIRQKIAEKFT